MRTTYEFPEVKNHSSCILVVPRPPDAMLDMRRYPGRHPCEGVPLAVLVREQLPLASLVSHVYGEKATMVLEGD